MSSTPTTREQRTKDDLAGKLARTEIQRRSSSIPGREIVQVRTEIPCGVESGWHIHPAEDGYIVAGTVESVAPLPAPPSKWAPIVVVGARWSSRVWSNVGVQTRVE